MYNIDYICAPIDCSRSSRAALALARRIATNGTTLGLLHAVSRWPAYMERVLFPYAPLGEDAPEFEHDLLQAATDVVRDYHKLGDDDALSIAFGRGSDALISHVVQTPAQLVVAGAFGEGGARPGMIGSVAHRLLLSANRPVLLVRSVDSNPTIKKVLVALDLSEGCHEVFEVAARLALRAEAELEVIHVVVDPLKDDHAQLLGNLLKFDKSKIAAQVRPRVEAHFERVFRAVEPGFSETADVSKLASRRRVMIGDPAPAIIDYAQTCGADTVVVGSQNPRRVHGALGRVAQLVAQRSTTHVLVVPTAAPTRLTDDE